MRTTPDFSASSAPMRPRGTWDQGFRTQNGTAPTLVVDYSSQVFGENGVRTLDPIVFSRSSKATYFDRQGALKYAQVNEKRIDFDPVTKTPNGLLIEGETTNMLTYSNSLVAVSWVAASAAVQSNHFPDPMGGKTMDFVRENVSPPAAHILRQDVSGQTGAYWSLSAFVRPAGRDKAKLRISGLDASLEWVEANFDLVTGAVVTSATAGAGQNVIAQARLINSAEGIWRISVSGQPVSGGAVGTVSAQFLILNSGCEEVYSGDGVSGLGIWGAQLEARPRASSYIETTDAPASRAADVAYLSLGSWFNPEGGSIVCCFGLQGSMENDWIWSLNDGTLSNRLDLRTAGGSITQYVVYKNAGTNQTPQLGVEQRAGDQTITALRFANNAFAAAWSGGSLVTSQGGMLPSNWTQLELGRLTHASRSLFGTLSYLLYFPVSLSDAELRHMTGTI